MKNSIFKIVLLVILCFSSPRILLAEDFSSAATSQEQSVNDLSGEQNYIEYKADDYKNETSNKKTVGHSTTLKNRFLVATFGMIMSLIAFMWLGFFRTRRIEREEMEQRPNIEASVSLFLKHRMKR